LYQFYIIISVYIREMSVVVTTLV